MAEDWKVTEAEAEAVIPKTGFIRDYIEYAKTGTDAPTWYHLGSIIGGMTTCSGFRDLRIMRSDGAISTTPIQSWNANVGVSGDRKSTAMDIVYRLMAHVLPGCLLADDGTVEAWHDTLSCDTSSGTGFMYRDELSSLLDQAKRSYSSSLNSWLLSAYRGGPLVRDTKKGGVVAIPRVRLNILGGIPPDTLTRKTTKSDWRSGFFTRFTFWAAERERFLPHEAFDLGVEQEFADWMKAILLEPTQQPIIISAKHSEIISDWCYENVEKQRKLFPPDVFSALTRLQEKGLRMAAMFALSELDRIPDTKPVKVTAEQCEAVLPILALLHRGALGMFNLIGSTAEHTEETQALYIISACEGITIRELAAALDTTMYRTKRLCVSLAEADAVELAPVAPEGVGRPATGIFLRR